MGQENQSDLCTFYVNAISTVESMQSIHIHKRKTGEWPLIHGRPQILPCLIMFNLNDGSYFPVTARVRSEHIEKLEHNNDPKLKLVGEFDMAIKNEDGLTNSEVILFAYKDGFVEESMSLVEKRFGKSALEKIIEALMEGKIHSNGLGHEHAPVEVARRLENNS